MIDLDEAGAKLRSRTDVGAPPIEEVRRRAGVRRRRRRAATGMVGALTVMVLVAGLVALWPDHQGERVIGGPASATVLPLPEPGATHSGVLRDGTPVFVVRHANGDTTVVSAISSHRPFGIGELVGWCRSSRTFDEPAHGSRFDERGTKLGGPAPSGLVTYDATVDLKQASIAIRGPRTNSSAPPGPTAGPLCEPTSSGGNRLELPTITGSPLTPVDAVRHADDAYHLVAGVFTVTAGDTLNACPATTPPATHCRDAVPVAGVASQMSTILNGQRFLILAHRSNGALDDIVNMDGPTWLSTSAFMYCPNIANPSCGPATTTPGPAGRITLEVYVSPVTAQVGQPVSVRVVADSPSGTVPWTWTQDSCAPPTGATFGDTTTGPCGEPSCGPSPTQAPGTPPRDHVDTSTAHTYARPGRYRIDISVRSGAVCSDAPSGSAHQAVIITVTD